MKLVQLIRMYEVLDMKMNNESNGMRIQTSEQ
jgi:hypothetical protein